MEVNKTVTVVQGQPCREGLASSNFFMQVLNSPSREEVNQAHFRGSWLGIGVPSVRNAFRVSKFKTWCWVLLLLSSIPIHVLFNSTIFETDHRQSDFHLTIGNERLVNGGAFFPPGGSLILPALASDDVVQNHWAEYYKNLNLSDAYRPDYSSWSPGGSAYGSPVNMSDYDTKNSPAVLNITNTAANAGSWDRLEAANCYAQYIDCHGLKKYRNVLWVMDQPSGWVRDDIWHLQDNDATFWDQYVPADQPNHLFFDAQCAMNALQVNQEPTQCSNTCSGALGDGSLDGLHDWRYPFIDNSTYASYEAVNGSDQFNGTWKHSVYTNTSGLQPDSLNLTLKYIALSPTLLMGVTICVIVKTVTAIVVTIVLCRRNQAPLVTLGDAIASFIEQPDRVTAGLSTVDQTDIRRAMRSKRAFLVPGPRQWRALPKRRASVVPISVWTTSYLLFLVGIGTCVGLFKNALDTNGLQGTFLGGDENSFIPLAFSLINAVLLANSPQLLLSFCYLAYNNMFTRLQMAREFAQFSDGYHPLRVTEPKGNQYSTYRLQLPYKYSLPLIAVSVFLHWLLSNTIYVFVSIGGYYGSDFVGTGSTEISDPSLPDNTAIAVGYSVWSLLVLMIVSLVLILIPPLLSFKRLSSTIVNPGSNSLALSAACHSSPLSHAARKSMALDSSPRSSRFDLLPSPYMPVRPHSPTTDGDEGDWRGSGEGAGAFSGIEMRRLSAKKSWRSMRSWRSLSLSSSTLLNKGDGDEEQGACRKLSECRLRWGVVKMPPEWYADYEHEEEEVGHLGFGAEGDDVAPPVPGRLYA
ncbi:Uu.00g097950.m01.CDS01 [Anthostomella pinea]|uniref:Uu.00g097950.m01.CDS01 n=1 Tax=Anthostomella pinea TaxID=933095 RepID=A0AAI8VCK9_9PEZI|nr:Uu.00g097950.m01.CDS01 [Anthostomella pinea]